MIRRLRLKFICITMSIVMVMLCVLLVTQYNSTRASLERISLSALESAAREPLDVGRPGLGSREQPCFLLSLNSLGVLRVSGSGYYDLSDTELLVAVYQAAAADGGTWGVLEEYGLRYYREDGMRELRYAFTDISGEIQTGAAEEQRRHRLPGLCRVSDPEHLPGPLDRPARGAGLGGAAPVRGGRLP